MFTITYLTYLPYGAAHDNVRDEEWTIVTVELEHLIEFVFAADGDVVSTVLVHLPCLVGDVIKHPPGRNEERGGGREKVGVREEKGGRREDDRFCYLYSARKTKYVLNYFTPLEYSHHRRRAHNTKIDMIVHHSTFHVFDVIVKMYQY